MLSLAAALLLAPRERPLFEMHEVRGRLAPVNVVRRPAPKTLLDRARAAALLDARRSGATFARENGDLSTFGERSWRAFYEVRTEFEATTPGTASLVVGHSFFAGGAHPGYVLKSFVVGPRGPLALKDLFRPAPDRLRPLRYTVIERLKRSYPADSFFDGALTGLKDEDLDTFAVTKEGLEFWFSPYALGPWAVGSFHVKVPKAELRGYVGR